MIDPSNMGSRLEAMAAAGRTMDDRLKETLVFILLNDPSMPVRLRSLDILSRHPSDPIVQDALLQSSERTRELQRAVIQKAEVLSRAAAATEQVVQLERALNENLAALAGAKNFEKTVMSLAATIHLLNVRLSDLPAEVCNVQLELDPGNEAGQAA